MQAASQFSGAADYTGESFAFETLHDKPAVCLLLGQADAPVQLLATASLRTMLRKRLGPKGPDAEPSKRADLREIVRRITWVNVFSRFEADVEYVRQARSYFPRQHTELMRQLEVQFVGIDPQAAFPKWLRLMGSTDSLMPPVVFGPLPSKAMADKWIEQVESAFDLCRYHHILSAAPRGQACAYKDMGRCPAPCDGTISMDAYRQQVNFAVLQLGRREAFVSDHTHRMTAAAANMAFESAGRIKQYVDEITKLFASAGSRPGGKFVRSLGAFRYVVVQRGDGGGKSRVFAVGQSGVHMVGEWDKKQPSDLTDRVKEAWMLTNGREMLWDEVGVFCQHLFTPAAKGTGVILHESEVTPASLAASCQSVIKRSSLAKGESTPAAEAASAGERELSAES